ncbi:MAG: hypothetical protein ABSG22_10585 [Sedimentisphaerales bacterium]|jgi:hypothetical protein
MSEPRVGIEIKIDKAQMNKISLLLKEMPGGIEEALHQAIRKTVTETKKEIIEREIAAVGVARKYLTRAINARWSKISGMISVLGKRIPLIAFRAHRGPLGATFEAGGLGFIPSAFEATMPGGHTGIFRRYSAGWRGQKALGGEFGGGVPAELTESSMVGRLSIQEIFGPSPGAILEQAPGMFEGVKQSAGGMLERMLDIATENLIFGGNIKSELGA